MPSGIKINNVLSYLSGNIINQYKKTENMNNIFDAYIIEIKYI